MLNKTDFEKVLRPVETAESLPPVCYVDEVLFEREMARGFRGGWVSVGRLDNLVVPGDYLALDVGATPLLLLLDSSHQLRAFANTCRHRGMRLLPPGRGRCERIICPFLSLIHISEPTRLRCISYAVFCLKKKNYTSCS